ncbi:hypothetical protein AXF42_Ash006954 [Apostasia shenzhenica]|uniref:RNase H type-1 domain-containing protein n=1 Tax=Apostasia shenzhenica TaxID=1088818 RepID=A0A2I0BEN0_9ASPA|nr:hypothetical protein AXF42_Ash006954 [Apostasia shenzhenica]
MMDLNFRNGDPNEIKDLFIHWSQRIKPSKKGCIFTHIILFTCWSLWKARNNKKFREIKYNCTQIVANIRHLVLIQHSAFPYNDWQLKGNPYFLNLVKSNQPICRFHFNIKKVWKKPDYGFVKLNFDGILCDGKAAGGGIIRDSEGNFIYAYHCVFNCDNVIIAEILAALFGMDKCKEKGYNRIHLDLVSMNIMSWIRDDNDIGWNFIPLVFQLKSFIHDLQANTTHILKEANQVANFFSKLNHANIAYDSFDAVPVEGQNLILVDKMGMENFNNLAFEGARQMQLAAFSP